MQDFVDLRSVPNGILKAAAKPGSPLKMLPRRAQYEAYCEQQGKKGLIWAAERGWTEICLLREHFGNNVVIEHVEKLGKSYRKLAGSLIQKKKNLRKSSSLRA